jgi:hypothetical protein
MKNVYIIVCFIAVFILGACGSGDSPAYDDSLSPANATKPVTPVTIADTLLSDTTTTTAAISATPVSITPSVTPGPTTVVAESKPVASKNIAGLNPAHGQPGHRCDIAVGAPLNSPPVQTTSQVQAPPVQMPQVQASPAPVQKSPSATNGLVKINPPHGQPGHDCAVKVGDPLKN